MAAENLLAKTEISWQVQFLYSAQSMLEFFAIMVIFGKKQDVLMAAIGQFGWQNQKVCANGIYGSRPVFFGQTEPLEPVNNVGRKQKQLEERHIGFPRVAGDFGQGIIVKKFPVVLFDNGSGIVKQIHSPCRHLEVGHENMINILGVFEQGQLFGFPRVFRDRAPDYNKPVRAYPFLMDVLEEFPYFPAVVENLETAYPRFGFDNGIFLGYDDVPAAYSVEESNYSLTIESGIHPEANAASGNLLRCLGQADFQEFDGSSGRCGVAGTQSSMPEFLTMRLETEQRMITSSPMLLGIVTNSASLLFAVNGDDHRVQVEYQVGASAWQSPEIRPEAVVKPYQLTNRLGIEAFQEPPQSRLVRETAQSQHVQKESVVLQDFGLVDTFQSHNNGVQQCHDQFGRMIFLVLLGKTNRLLQELLEPKLLAKSVNQEHSTEVRQMAALEENFDFVGSFWHNTQTSHLVHFLCEEFDRAYYTPFSSEIQNLKSKNRQFPRIFED